MKGFGVSVYPDMDGMDEIKKYLKLASKYGCQYVFSSMFSVQGTKQEILDYFQELTECAHENEIQTVLDLNPPFLKKMGVSYDDVSLMQEIGCDVMRMDLQYGKEKDLILAQNPYGISIMFNASGHIIQELAYFEEHGISKDRIMLGHNFYPQPYTGLKWDYFQKTNAAIKQYGYPVQCFISSHAQNSHGVWDAVYGLPTVEKMRRLPIDLQAREYLATDNVDMVWIGNAFASEEEFASLQEAMAAPRPIENSPLKKILESYGFPLPQYTEDKKLRVIMDNDATKQERYQVFDLYPQSDLGDSSEWIWRSRAGRMMKPDIPARPYAEKMFAPGDIVIVNNNYAHYAGEVQIVRMPIENDGIRNHVGRLAEGELDMLALIHDSDVVTFLEEK
ncbi:MAG: MupG family TIM beta-alpha barrel fold protein [Lactimicrobium massiliense]|nr:MupG family TIM beta-alpha barrel fold protein [Lactimicrobium massiliense]MDD6674497.1 MupG family TIM beta-alpha barrel fold protein [Lactimicrobium massiliense]